MYDPPIEPDRQRHGDYQALLGILRDAYRKHQDDFRRLQNYC
jgi:hypothetical protein